MSKESFEWLANFVVAGYVETRRPWWVPYAEAEGHTANLYPGAVPMDVVEKLLASWNPVEAGLFDLRQDYDKSLVTLYDADMKPVEAIRASDISLVETHKLIKASDDFSRLAVVGADRATHSYGDWLTGTVNECVGDEAQVSSAGLLRGRAQAWVQIERPETAVGPDGILFSPYVTLSTSYDGSQSSQINQNTQMVVCDNTLEIARQQGIAVRHTKNSNLKLGDYRGVMTAIMQGESDFRAELERQLKVEVSGKDFDRFLEAFVPYGDDDIPAKRTRSERKRQEITHLYRYDPRVIQFTGTEFGVVQAVNTWNTHESQLRNATGFEMDDTNLRAMKNYAERLKGNQGRDMETAKILESVLV